MNQKYIFRLLRTIFSILILGSIAACSPESGPIAEVEVDANQEILPGTVDVFERDNLMAWCIVPFDGRKRGPEERAEMMARLGFTKFAYDWRAEHIPTFDEEMAVLKRYNIELSAFWFPSALNEDAQTILAALEKNGVKTQLWVTMNGGPIECTPEEHAQRVAEHVEKLRPIVEAADAIGCSMGLYNHGGWFGEPENQIDIVKALGADNVGLVYNQHHGHAHVDRFEELLAMMTPYLYALNLNGTVPGGDKKGQKIVPLAHGDLDVELLTIIQESAYVGPIGILGHTQDDAEKTLKDNLDGLEWLRPQLKGVDAQGPKPVPTRESLAPKALGAASITDEFGFALAGGQVIEGKPEYGKPPVTVSCRVRVDSHKGFNILIANHIKVSGAHWELFTEPSSGNLAVYMPGQTPDHLRTGTSLKMGEWYHLVFHYKADAIRLFINGKNVGEIAIVSNGKSVVEGGLAFGQLVEGGLFCDGLIDDVHIQKGIVFPSEMGKNSAVSGETTLGLWSFNNVSGEKVSSSVNHLEDEAARLKLPEYQVIPAAKASELTPSNGLPSPDSYTKWSRSHGDSSNSRFSSLSQINRENVQDLEVAWEYQSGDGADNVQCNPIVVGDTLYTSTPGHHLVALDARNGDERWRFKGGDYPAKRGLVYWPGNAEHEARLMVNAGEWLYALNPETGIPIEHFGSAGKVQTGRVFVAGAIYKHIIVLPGYERDVFGYDVISGEKKWTFHTLPQEGEFGYDTWDGQEQGANCWGGMAMDEERGLAFVATGSPKPNFIGLGHKGSNLFANCVIALDALTGERKWHFQEIRHDIWDLDIPAPPNLVSVMKDGQKVDAVAQVTKIGNTLLLDRVTGRPLYPFRLRRAPVSKLPGEQTWSYQPDVEVPEPFAKQEFRADDITNINEDAGDYIQQRLGAAKFGWFESFEEGKPTVFYGIHGGAEWTGAAFDPRKGKLYVSANEIPWTINVFRQATIKRNTDVPKTRGHEVYEARCVLCHGDKLQGNGVAPPLLGLERRMDDAGVRALLETGRGLMPAVGEISESDVLALFDFIYLREPGVELISDPLSYTFNGFNKLLDLAGYPGSKPPWGTLNCIDLNTGKIDWKVPLGVYPELAKQGLMDTGAENFGGATVTAGGLVFCAGTPDNLIRAFDSETGEELWQHSLPFGGYAPPTVYAVDGKEYVVVAATGGGKLKTEAGDAWVAFALP